MVKYEEKGTNYSHSVSYEYDKNTNLTQQVEVTNGVTTTTAYTYDDDNRIKTVTTGDTVVTYTYDTYGRVSQKVTTTGTPAVPVKTEAFTYTSPAGSTSAQVATYAITYSDRTVTYTYTYDNNGNILSVYDDWGQYTTSYAYDSANQLVRENNQYWEFTHDWEYDSAGNIKNRKEYAYTTGELQNTTATRTVTYGYPSVPPLEEGQKNPVWGDLLTSLNGENIVYDGIGNPTSGYGWNYTWEHGRQLKAMSGDFEDWTYEYNADGMRTMRTNGTRTYEYVYNGSQLTQMKVDGYTFNFTYDANGTPLTISQGNEVYYYITNLQGDVVALHSVTGGSEALYSYDAWGMCRCDAFSDIEFYNPLRYRGYVYDEETQLYYLQSRYYDPSVGRFLNADGFTSTGQGVVGNNMFVYCGNNPIIYEDSSGTRHEIGAGAVGPYKRKGQNIENMMKFFNVSSADELPPLPDNAMVVAENVLTLPTPFGFSFVYGRSIVMDNDKYCEYTFSGYSYGGGFPVDRYDTVGYVYGVEAVSDYEGLFLGGSVNLIADIQGGAVAPNKVWSEVIGGNGFISASSGVSITNYTASSADWIYGKANVHWYVSPHAKRYDPNM